MKFINKNELYKELISRYGKSYTYIKVCMALDGDEKSTSDKEKKQILAVVEEQFKKVKENILKS
jgi:hypothetical protein